MGAGYAKTIDQNRKQHEISAIGDSSKKHHEWATESILMSIKANCLEKVAFLLNPENH